MEVRREPGYPPFARLINVVVSGLEEAPTQEAATAAADWVSGLLAARRVRDVVMVGPAPCPIDRIRGRWRWHFLLRGHGPRTLGRVSRYFYERWRPKAPKSADLRVIIDRDPVQLL
jgi:primosomal protein N' (replication factor Y)